jgi:hypothetical protein
MNVGLTCFAHPLFHYNPAMTEIQILLPFGLPPAALATDLVRECKLPALATLIARTAALPPSPAFDHFARALPHEAWLAHEFGLTSDLQADNSPPVAAAAMQALGITPEPGNWFIVNPVHFHIARDHLVLTDQRQLMLTEAESRALFDAARPYFDEVGKPLLYGDAQTWFVRADDWHGLQTSTPDAACGHNIDIWMPQGTNALAWRKLQNEVQMLWHTHAVNTEREMQGSKPVNSLWLWGGAAAPLPTGSRRQQSFNLPGWLDAFGQLAQQNQHDCSAADLISAAPQHGLLMLDALIGPALAGDWSQWLQQIHALEADWLAPLLAALSARRLDRLSVVLSHGSELRQFGSTPLSLRKFWRKPSLNRLLP